MLDLIWQPDSYFIDEIGKLCGWQLFNKIEKQSETAGPNSCLRVSYLFNTSSIQFLNSDSRRHGIMTKNIFFEIHPNGYILLSERLTMKLKCPMSLKYFPFDLQICPIRIESYAFRAHQVKIFFLENRRSFNPYWQITETKSKNLVIRQRYSRIQYTVYTQYHGIL